MPFSLLIIMLLISGVELALGILVLVKNSHSKINLYFFGFSLAVILWTISNYLADALFSFFWTRMTYVGSTGIAFFLVLFVDSLELPTKFIRWTKWLIIFFTAFISILVWIPKVFLESVIPYDQGVNLITGPLYIFYPIFFGTAALIALGQLIYKFKQAKGIRRIQLKYLLYGIIVSLILGFLLNSIIPLITGDYYVTKYGPLSAMFFIGFTTYAIVRYRFMDIRIFIGKAITYILVAAFAYGAFYGIIWFNNEIFGSVFSLGAYLIGIVFAIAFTIIFYPLQKLIQKITKHYLFAEVYNSQEVISTLTNQLTTIINLKQIIDLIVDTIRSTMNLDRSGVLLIETSVKPIKYKIAKVVGFDEHNGISLVQDNFLTQYLTKTQKPIVKEELDFLSEQAKNKNDKQNLLTLRDHMHKIEASICLPLISQNTLIGIVVLGSKVSGGAYTNEDLNLLTSLSNQASIAITNARYYKETQDFNKTLQKKVDEQTKEIKDKAEHMLKLLQMRSEFLDIASHQLRTPTSVIKGTLAMMKAGDMDKMSAEDKAKFVDAMYWKSVKLEEIINDILMASEMDTAGDNSMELNDQVDLSILIDKVVSQHGLDAENKKLQIIWTKPTEPMILQGNSRYLEEAINNILDNAIKYTAQGSITVSLIKDKGKSLLTIQDTGIGIPKEDQDKVFKKFIRAKNARNAYTDGSGLGLFIVKEVVDKHPGAKVWVESEENKGTKVYLEFTLLATNK